MRNWSGGRAGGTDFRAAWWLPGAHLQTIWGRLARPRRLIPLEREVVRVPDGDDLVLDHLEGDPLRRVVLLHGLEGSSSSVYMQGMLREIRNVGASATVLNFRSCARDPRKTGTSLPNRGKRLYHSGETSDLAWLAGMLRERHPRAELVAIGVSLGGNVLLKYAGETGDACAFTRIATISVPYDLAAGARHLETITGRLYVRSFVRSLTAKAEAVCRRHADLPPVDLERARRAWTFFEFDDAVTAPLHGFSGADEYYHESSAIRWVGRIKVPTLCISAADDPFLPPLVLERLEREASEAVRVLCTRKGGHVGFVHGLPWKPRYWAESVAVQWSLLHEGTGAFELQPLAEGGV